MLVARNIVAAKERISSPQRMETSTLLNEDIWEQNAWFASPPKAMTIFPLH